MSSLDSIVLGTQPVNNFAGVLRRNAQSTRERQIPRHCALANSLLQERLFVRFILQARLKVIWFEASSASGTSASAGFGSVRRVVTSLLHRRHEGVVNSSHGGILQRILSSFSWKKAGSDSHLRTGSTIAHPQAPQPIEGILTQPKTMPRLKWPAGVWVAMEAF